MSIDLAHCEVFHARTAPKTHKFRYDIGYLLFDTRDGITEMLRAKFGRALQLRAGDYLDGKSSSFDQGIRTYLRANCDYDGADIRLMTLPRVFGYAFNPINFWLCSRAAELEAVLCEVNNTFGERHCYWIHPRGGISDQWIRAEKVLHVSPFFPVDGYYEFRFNLRANDFQFDICYKSSADELRLVTYLKGQLTPLSQISPTSFFRRYGWISLAVIARIHYQAALLWLLKSATFFRKPAPPPVAISIAKEKDHP